MRTIRRLYFYAVAFVSLEVVLWGLIGLARTSFTRNVVAGTSSLAQALSLILVGVPIFLLHWLVSQRSAAQDSEEHSAGLRAVFLYGILLATLIPMTQNGFALINRSLLQGTGLDPLRSVLGGSQNLADNLIAIIFNAVVAAYFTTILRRDWQTITEIDSFADVRRIYRYIWVIYSLGMTVFGVQQMLRFVLYIPTGEILNYRREVFLNGLSLVIVGLPIWIFAWKTAQDALAETFERESILRLAVLYVLALSGVITVLTTAGILISTLLRMLLGESMSFGQFMNLVAMPLSLGIPLGGVWAYYGHWLGRDMASVEEGPRRASLRRLYFYILSLIGLGATVFGLSMLLSFVVDMLVGLGPFGDSLRRTLSASLATLFASLPLWWLTWRPMQAEALTRDDEGDHARRSVVRKAYLYFVLFASVIGGMASAVGLIFQLLSALLGNRPSDFTSSVLNLLQILVIFIVVLVYHLGALRRDGQMAATALAARHSQFTTILFDPGNMPLVNAIAAAVEKKSPQLPLAVQPISEAIPEEAKDSARAVILPGELAVNPPESLRLWMNEFEGHRVVVPAPTEGWVWAGGPGKSASSTAKQVAEILQQLAEGQPVSASAPASPWMIVLYVIAAIFGLQVILLLFSLVVSGF